MLKNLEHHEHAEHIAHGHAHAEGTARPKVPPQWAALLVATLAAGLAISEQGAKHAEIRVQENLVNAVDAWAQYQAKSTRSTMSKNVAALVETLEPPSTPEVAERRRRVVEQLGADQERFDKDPKDGREAISERAHGFEHARDHALEQTHAYHNGSAAMELGIVLATASAIIGSRLLIGCSLALGVLGGLCAVAGYAKPEWGVF